MAKSSNIKSPLSTKTKNFSLDFFLRFLDPRIKTKYSNYVHERTLTIIKIMDIIIILGAITIMVYLILELEDFNGYGALSYNISLIVTIVVSIVILFFIGLSIWLHFKKKKYSDLLLFVINTFSIVFLLEINIQNPIFLENPSLYFSYSHRFGLMNLMFVICYKSWLFKNFQVCFGSIYFHVRLVNSDAISMGYNLILTVFCCFLFYFLEKHDKLAFKTMIESEKQNRSWKKILNTFPEGIAISKADKNLLFINLSLKQLLNESNEEKLKQVLFFEIKKKLQKNASGFSFESHPSDPSENPQLSLSLNKEITFNEIFDDFILRKNIKKQKSMANFVKKNLNQENGMKLQVKLEKNKHESFVTRLNDRFLEIKIAKFAYEFSGPAFIIILSDITENFKLRMLEESKAFKNSLFGSFTHEFRTPLNALFLLTKALLLQDSISEDIKSDIIDPIVFNSEILHNLINTISDYVAFNMHTFKLHKTIFNLKSLLTEAVKILTCLAKARGLQTELKLGPGLHENIFNDENRIRQILYQFFSNSLKFTTSGKIKVSAKVKQNKIQISVKDSGIGMNEKDMETLSRVMNQKINYINYERVNGSAGASLGLTISNKIAKKLDKKPNTGIGFKSVIGQGAKFYFTIKNKDKSKKVSCLNLFRLSKNFSNANNLSKREDSFKKFRTNDLFSFEKKESSVKESCNESQHDNLKKKFSHEIYSFESKFFNHFPEIPKKSLLNEILFINSPTLKKNQSFFLPKPESENQLECGHEPILIVDDDEFNIIAVTMLLKIKNFKCQAARNGQLALDLIEDQCKRRENCCKCFKLIIMDLNMPVLNGIETSKKLNQSFEEGKLPWMPIVMCTAYESETEGTDNVNSGIVEVIYKPLKMEVLGRVIENWIIERPEK